MKSVKSARGQTVDFDLLKIKQQIAAAPKTVEVKNRENFIEQRNKRRLKKMAKAVTAAVKEVVVEPVLTTNDSAAESSDDTEK